MKSPAQLNVELPKNSLTINAVALKLAEKLPRRTAFPPASINEIWSTRLRNVLTGIVRLPKDQPVEATRVKDRNTWTFKVGGMTIPIVEFLPAPESKGTTIVIADGGRAAAADRILQLQKEGRHVLVADLYYFGEMHPTSHDWLWTLMLATVGDRALGIQAAQLNAVAKWAKGDVQVVAIGPRTSTIALVAAAVDAKAIGSLELHEPLGSLKEILEEKRVVAKTPELFCFGLLEEFDTVHLAALVAPRPVSVKKPSDRVKKDWAGLEDRYKSLGKEFDPLK